MKVSRQNIEESYPTTVSWISSFENSLLKNADFISNIKSILHNPDKKFSSVEEKLADIRERVGLDMVSGDGSGNIGSKTSSASCSSEKSTGSKCSSCSTGNSCGCSSHGAESIHSQEDISKMKTILEFISDMIMSEPHLETSMVVSKCREDDDLKFDELNIDLDMLKEHIGKLIGKYRENDDVAVKYVPYEPSQMEFSEDSEADYYRHAHT
tara:strand:- start:96 stop:728 length:633 start_codon:yes stop_codon:yes gene_type:complete